MKRILASKVAVLTANFGPPVPGSAGNVFTTMSSIQPETRAEAHATTPTHKVRYSRRTVVRALEAGHVGRENAISGKDLARYVPIAYTTVRDVIAELRDDPLGPPIGQCGSGYYVLESEQELDEWVRGVKEEIATKRERLRANVESFNRRKL